MSPRFNVLDLAVGSVERQFQWWYIGCRGLHDSGAALLYLTLGALRCHWMMASRLRDGGNALSPALLLLPLCLACTCLLLLKARRLFAAYRSFELFLATVAQALVRAMHACWSPASSVKTVESWRIAVTPATVRTVQYIHPSAFAVRRELLVALCRVYKTAFQLGACGFQGAGVAPELASASGGSRSAFLRPRRRDAVPDKRSGGRPRAHARLV